MSIGKRMQSLRKEQGWSQGDLAKRLGSDARQISRYENDKVTPSAEALVKLAQVFDVSVDHLLLEDAPRRPVTLEDKELFDRLRGLTTLNEDDRVALIHVIDALIAKSQVKALAQKLT